MRFELKAYCVSTVFTSSTTFGGPPSPKGKVWGRVGIASPLNSNLKVQNKKSPPSEDGGGHRKKDHGAKGRKRGKRVLDQTVSPPSTRSEKTMVTSTVTVRVIPSMERVV